MAIYFGLGSNQGDRFFYLNQAISLLKIRGFEISRVSPIVESPAMLPNDAESSWARSYLNCVIEGSSDLQPNQALLIVKNIEKELGRKNASKRWEPRPIDIDILLWDDRIYQSRDLTIPHIGLSERSFVLTPLCFLQPDLVVPGIGKCIFELTKSSHLIPLWMGVVNRTPDSFSDGNRWIDEKKLAHYIDRLIESHVQIIDFGAESTRPNADIVNSKIEWKRLLPALTIIQNRIKKREIKPLISLDSRHFTTLEKGVDFGVNIINDVSGLSDQRIIALVRESQCHVIAMHSLSVPSNPKELLENHTPVLDQLSNWLHKKVDFWLDSGINLNKIIFDPGVGFSKTILQTIEILKNCSFFRDLGLRLLIGHSRKSFMNSFTDHPVSDRDLETLGISLGLCGQGVDIIRVHDPIMHIRAYRAWSQTLIA